MTAERRTVKVFLAGEGRNELGSRCDLPGYQTDANPGVLHRLLERVQPTGWEVGGAREWKRIRKYRVGTASHQDTHNVLGVALDAKEAGCDVLAFSCDVDTDPARKEAIEEGIGRAQAAFASGPEVIGGAAVPMLEGWILALLETAGTEGLSAKRLEEALTKKGVSPKDGEAMATVVESADLARIPRDAESLRAWLDRARAVLPPLVSERASAE